ncbi:MAG TPA: AMP-binding protein [Ramlibacter sp.]|nr:AMP-binding protein [Ramlibacter sp.]
MEARRWHASYPQGLPHDITIDEKETLVTILERAFATQSDRTALTCASDSFSYADLDRLSGAFARYLLAIGLRPGDRVALMLPSCAPFMIAMAGVLRASMAVVTVNPLYTPREVEQQLADSGASLIVAAESLRPVLLPLVPRTAVRQIVTTPIAGLHSAAQARETGERAVDGSAEAALAQTAPETPMGRALQIGHASAIECLPPQPGDAAFLQYTGGTTGVSKGAVLTHRSVCASLRQMMSWMCLSLPSEGLSIVTPLPLYHVYPLAVSLLSLALGGNNRLVPNPRDLSSVIAEMKRGPFSMFIGVNTLFNALVDAPELSSVDFSGTRLVTGAGASVQGAVARRWEDAGGPPITEGYGLTETSPSATFNPPGRNGTIGIPVPSTDVRIVSEDGRDVQLGAAGELLLRGPQLFAGYWQRSDETAKAFTDDGWFKTGDVVTMDPAGFMYMVDRKKDMILVSGFNVYPNEIEAVVAGMPEIVECACIGVPDARSGETPHLFVVRRHAGLLSAQVEAHCRANLAAYKVPRHVTFVEALPKSTVGKILRRELRQS